ncbi:MAG: glutathione S-transferase family protein [Archangium sp.]|nr:glutathione S-transferase family protein [Archangium sp.]MDP3570701.1 glutathione S-transferase family protein [Archangium sp.]
MELIGRRSSHFTRVALVFAHELGVPVELIPVHDITATDSEIFAGNPALKIPTLRRDGSLVFGTENICRSIAEQADPKLRVVWPEELRTDLSRNAQELTWHCMSAQVQLVFGTVVGKLPADNVYFAKGRAGFEGALRWLDSNVDAALAALPADRAVSLFEVTLFCLLEHLSFRGTLPIAPYPALQRFVKVFGKRASSMLTSYRFDTAPSP